jgi:sulfite reductase (NADPH) flavoprotein alpha-component
MTTVPVIPDSAPFTAEQRAWLNGYLAGLFSRGQVNSVAATATSKAPAAQLTPLTILFGSQTGGAEALAKRAAKEAGKRGFAATILDMGQIDAAKLANEKNVLIITSTYGDGEPPDNAKALHAQLAAATVSLPTIRYSVCSLGDTNYVQFCKCGKDFDEFLEKLGATRVSPRIDCDLDYETKFTSWLNDALTALSSEAGRGVGAAPINCEVGRVVPNAPSDSEVGRGLRSAPAGNGVPAPPRDTAPGYSRNNPFSALLLTSRNLNGEGSAKEVNHVEFALEQSGLAYEAGDALGVYPHNCPELVNEVLGVLGCDGEEAVPAPDGTTTSLRRALAELYDLGKPTPELLSLFGSGGGGGTAIALHHVIDVLMARVDVKLAPTDFVRSLKRLQPRLYSISSSPKAHAGNVHLTVGAVRYDVGSRVRKGVCSTFLADRIVPGETRVGIFVHSNKAFRPPADGNTPMIMVGPGTGIAPFRAFLHERRATGARGRNWLFFGDQRSTTDFLYQDELQAFQADGLLTRLDLAWSRDQQEKVYVQNRMTAAAVELYSWLEAGAHFYVCGDATRMAKDVDAALHTVIEKAGGKTAAQAADYVQVLRSSKRYCRDVY